MKKDVRIIGIPMDLGQSLRGVDMGPSAVRYAGLATRLRHIGYRVDDAGNVEVPVRDYVASQAERRFLPAVQEVCRRVYEQSRDAIADDAFPLFIGGDHSLAIGTIGGVTEEAPTGVIWVDAHGDVNTMETSPSGNIHGMPLAALLGEGAPELVDLGRAGPKLRPKDVAIIGVRDLDAPEQVFLREREVGVYTMREVDERGMAGVAKEVLERLSHVERIHVSFDLDSLEPRDAPGVGTPVPGGLTYREAHLLMEILADSGRVASVEFVEVNPILDVQNQTARLAVALISSLLGKSII